MQVVLIILTVAFIVILLGINLYLLTLYMHPDDKGFCNVVYMKVLAILGLTVAQAQALMIPLDVANRSAIQINKLDMATFWFFLYIIVLAFITIILPYAIFYYDSDQDYGIFKRLCVALCYTTISIIVTIAILVASWGGLRFVNVPFTKIQLNFDGIQADPNNINLQNPASIITSEKIGLQASFPVYVVAILSFFGWIFLAIFGGVGISALPIDLINQFRFRPKPRHSSQMKRTKDRMGNVIANMIQQGQKLLKFDESNRQAGWFQRWKSGRSENKKFTQFKVKYHVISQQFQIFNLQLKYAQTNPIVPYIKLILGIVFIITSILWIIQILVGNVIKSVYDRPLIPLFNQMFIYLQERNAGVITTAVFAYLCLYLLWCVLKGNIKFGIRIPFCCRFHPMKQNQTWMNSFLFNVIFLLIASVGLVQLCISSFPTYTRNTDIYMIFGVQVRYMRFYEIFYQYSIFHIAFLVWALITFIYQLFTCDKKPQYMKDIEKIRQDQQQ